MNTLVLYKSISGFTKRYAQWIAEELNAGIFEINKLKKLDLNKYDVVVFGGSLHMVGINGLKEFKMKWHEVKNKKLIVFATGASPSKGGIIDEIKKNNFTQEELEHVGVFY